MISRQFLVDNHLRHFGQGLGGGIVLTLIVWALISSIGQYFGGSSVSPSIEGDGPLVEVASFIFNNLGFAAVVFSIVATVYLQLLWQLKKGLAEKSFSLLEVKKYTSKLQALSSLFFGVGVLWTAIGMRSALLVALGDLDADTAATLGAFEILKRLVDGGILIALSTTIVGGFGGYGMKLLETFTVAADIQSLVAKDDEVRRQEVVSLLQAIKANTATSPSRLPPPSSPSLQGAERC